MREPLADRDGVIERWALPGASHAVGEQSGEQRWHRVAELSSQLNGKKSWRQGVCHSPGEGRGTFRAKKQKP